MCGICGKYSPEGVQAADVRAMMARIAHRGPDDDGLYVQGSVGLGNQRLSIIDLPGGHQPISNETSTIWVVYNGEIYNYGRLRQELQEQGHVFRTESDTEVIVHLYEELGEDCVKRLQGMFAFALWDEQAQKLVLARDHLGQKPLFYSQMDGTFLFASELKAVLQAFSQTPEIDYESLHHYLSLRFIPAPGTMFRGIRKLPPGHYLVFQHGQVRVQQYWQLTFRQKLDLPEAELLAALDEKLNKTVQSHLVSDVPVGAFLSGGMDSSMIVALASRMMDEPLPTFAIGVAEQDFNELPYARQVAEHVNARHVEKCVEANLIQLLPKMIWHLDEPSDPIAACMYHAAELAAHHVKVVLGGDGGDELFAGFDRYLGFRYIGSYALIPSLLRSRLVGPIIEHLPDSYSYKSLSQQIRWVNQLSLLTDPGLRYAEATCFFRFSHTDKQLLAGEELWRWVGQINSAEVIADLYNSQQAESPVDRMLYTDYMTRLPEHSLMLTDRMTMAHGLEARSPFLDHDLVTFLAAFPDQLKIRNRELKYALRQVGENYLPETIVRRDKQGFMFPIAYWFRDKLYGFVHSCLLNSHFVREGLFRQEQVGRLLEEHRQGRRDNHVRLWMLLNLTIWHQLYIENLDLETVSLELGRHLRQSQSIAVG